MLAVKRRGEEPSCSFWAMAISGLGIMDGVAANTNRKGYPRPLVSVSSVNVIANPVRVAPIPKVIAHVPTNIIITTSGVGL